ncbi:hypothetical protein H1D32_11585 [Anaerobacillus sp. CMMVII]|uniref:hypothetical protein n=1 Tax=Anaerobacillus sp. CMMVII TaxID=2755588 RepID=UPI0021B822C2|nr:hypothetical protein [Anaerobacillus sp. CMMVII]MCT8138334.1 hypothetical protein [Anaerobacillus sp. CMMVII]
MQKIKKQDINHLYETQKVVLYWLLGMIYHFWPENPHFKEFTSKWGMNGYFFHKTRTYDLVLWYNMVRE